MKIISLVVLLSLLPMLAFSFGKNKVIYNSYQWECLDSEHFQFYIARDDLSLSNLILSTAESIYAHHTNRFEFVPKAKIRVILYRNQIDFQQNNIIDWTSPGTGGFTEFNKGRVVVPYSSFYPDFNHVLSHELNHAFQGFVWGKGNLNIQSIRDIDIPLWMIEGSAEYNSIGLDRECEMIIADGIINGILPSLDELADLYGLNRRDYFYVYKEGQAFYEYIEKTYGTNIFAKLNASITEDRIYETVLSNTFQKKPEELNAEFFDYLRKKYMPEVPYLSAIDVAASKIIREDSLFNMNPVELDSNRIAFISERKIYPSIVIFDKAKNTLDKLVRGGFDEDFLEFQYGKRNNLAVSTNGLFIFVSRSGGRDAIHLYNLKNNSITRLDLPFSVINSPDIAPNGKEILFSASDSNQKTALYSYSMADSNINRLFTDDYYDTAPRFLDKERIVFASNRKKGPLSNDLDIVVYNRVSGQFELLIDTGFSDEYPTVSKDGSKIAFVRMDTHPTLMIFDIGNSDLTKGILYQELRTTGGILSPAFTSSGSLLLTAFHKNSYNVYEYQFKLTNKAVNTLIQNQLALSRESSAFKATAMKLSTYQNEFSIDNLIGGFTLNTSLGMAAMGMLSFSDLFGDERYQILMDTALQIDPDLFNYLNIDFTYLNFRYRHNFGVRLYHYSNYFYEFSTFQEFFSMEKPYYSTFGGAGLYIFPFSTFDRIEAEAGYRGFNYVSNIINTGSNAIYQTYPQSKTSLKLSYVHDSTLNDITGPVDGIRYEFLLLKTFPVLNDSISYTRVVADFRSYWLLYPGYSIALRGVAGKSFESGSTNAPFYLGGFNSIRGYNLWSYKGDTMFLMNFEIRVPFIADWVIGFPFPIRMPTIWGTIFFDVGSTWNWGDPYSIYTIKDDTFYFDDLKCGMGFGFRLVLMPGIKLMVDLATPYDGSYVPNISRWYSFWQVGIDF